MVVKSATKKKLMDSGWTEPAAHEMATERKWQDVLELSPFEMEVVLRDANITDIFESSSQYTDIWDWWFRTPRTWEFKFNDKSKLFEFQFKFMGDANKYVMNSNGVIREEEMGFEGLGSLFGGQNKNSWWTWEELATGKLNPHFEATDITKMIKQLGGSEDIVRDIVTKVCGGKYRSDSSYIDAINRHDILEIFVPISRCKHGIDMRKECSKCEDEMFDGLGSLFG